MINGSFDASKYVFNARNPHFKRALELRRDGQYKEAGKELTIAAEVDGDLEALIMQYEALVNGGFGMKRTLRYGSLLEQGKKDFLLCRSLRHVLVDYYGKDDLFVLALLDFDHGGRERECVEKLMNSFKNGNVLSLEFYCNWFKDNSTTPFVKLGAELGDVGCCHYMLEIVGSTDQSYVQCGLKQFYNPIGNYWDQHRSHVLPRIDWMWYIIKFDRIAYIERAYDSNLSEKEMYKFGKWVKKRYFPSRVGNPFKTNSRPWDLYLKTYNTINQQCQQSVFCFLFYFKPILGKDVTKIIAQRIWKSRKEEPETWNPEEKRKRRKK